MKPLPLLFVLALAAGPAPAETASSPEPAPSATPVPTPVPQTPRQIIDTLSDAQLDQAIQSLRSQFLDGNRTDDRELRRATLTGLTERLEPGVSLTTEAAAAEETRGDAAFLAEILDDRIGYLRPGSLTREALPQTDAALANFKEKNLHALILDLRGMPLSMDYDVAADFARRLCPKGKLLFTVQKPSAKQERILTSDQDPAFSGILVILTDQQTAGGAEALAATLRLNANAMIVGATTRGKAVEFSDIPLGDGKILRVAVAQVTLPGGGPIFPGGVKPDIAAALSADVQKRVFEQSQKKGISQFVFETERPHLNEAALVANTNPEFAPGTMTGRDPTALWDTVLQRAVDLITAISFYNNRQP